MRGKRLAAAAAVLSIIATACGGDDDDSAEGASTTEGASDGTAAEPSPTGETPGSTAVAGSDVATTETGEEPPTSATDGSAASVPDAADDAADDVALDPDATLRIIAAAPPPASWDPANTRNTTQDIQYFAYVYDTLLRLDGDNQVGPRLATAWEYDESNTVLTLTLREDVTFTDGSAFDAEVAKLNLDRVRTGTGAAARLLVGIESIEVQSPTELVITQAGPSAKILLALASPAAAMASPQAIADPAALAQTPVGSGPYTLEAADQASATFELRDDRWDADAQYVASVAMTGTPDGNARLNALLSGSVDIAQLSQTPPTPDALEMVDSGELQMVRVSGQPTLIGINNTVAPFDNPKVIEAINYAIDRDTFNEVVYNGLCEPVSQVFVEGQAGYIEGLEYEYDVDKARELMEEAGVGDVTVKFQTVAGAPTTAVELLQAMLGEIGISIDVTASPIAEVFPNFFSGQFGMSNLQLQLAVPDSSYTTDYLTGPLNPGTKDPELVELVDTANALAPDDPGRDAAYEAVNQYVFDHPIGVLLCRLPNVMLADPDVVGLDDIPFSTIGGNDYTGLGVRAG